MIFDVTDPIGAIQTVFSILILVELIQFLDKDDMGAHIQERVAFYSGIFGRIWGFVKLAGSGFQIIFNRIFPTNKQLHERIVKDMDKIFQMEEPEEEDPFEGEGVIEG